MKWILAPDSFKNCLRSPQVAAYLAEGIREISPGDTIIELPLADGGEGTVEAAARATGGRLEECRVSGPLGEPVMAHHALLSSGCALLELAEAAGLERIPESGRDPLRTTTFGVGEQLRNLLDAGIRNFVIGIGGSATVDGGIGLFQALGGLCRDAAGREIPAGAGGGVLERIAFLDVAGLHPGVAKSVIRIASDVTNPLTGPRGAARIFAPQKGASPAEVERLEHGLIRWAELWNDPGDSPGDGAAGGIGFLLRKLGGRMESGAALLLDLAQLLSGVIAGIFAHPLPGLLLLLLRDFLLLLLREKRLHGFFQLVDLFLQPRQFLLLSFREQAGAETRDPQNHPQLFHFPFPFFTCFFGNGNMPSRYN